MDLHTPGFTIDDVKFADGPDTFKKAEGLHKNGKIGAITDFGRGYSATVRGTKLYSVMIDSKHVEKGDCSCYMGQNGYICKHMLALALAVLHQTNQLTETEALTEFADVQKEVTKGMSHIKAYSGASSTWFRYQGMLAKGSGIITDAIQELPASKKHADYLWKLVLRLSKKYATGGVDDSDGVLGNCVFSILERLAMYAKEDPALRDMILRYCNDDTGFGFEDELKNLLKNTN